MRYPDMLSAAQKGIELGAMINKLPRAAHENAAQSAMASIAQEQAKNLQDNIKYIQGAKDLTPEQRTLAIQKLMIEGGFGYGQGGGTLDPLGAAVRLQSYQQSQEAFPLEQQQRGLNLQTGAQNLQGGPAASAAGSPNPVGGQQTQQPQQPAQQPKPEHLLNNGQKTTMTDTTYAPYNAYPPVAPIAAPATNFDLNSGYPPNATFLA